jgi:hypothetical protein
MPKAKKTKIPRGRLGVFAQLKPGDPGYMPSASAALQRMAPTAYLPGEVPPTKSEKSGEGE